MPEIQPTTRRRAGPERAGGSAEYLAQHLAGRVGEAIDMAFSDPSVATRQIEAVLETANSVIEQYGLHQSLDDFVGQTDVDEAGQRDAFLSGSVHGVTAVARTVGQELAQLDRDEIGAHEIVAKRCQDVANRLMVLDLPASDAVAETPFEPVDGVEPCVLNSYMYGVRESLESIVGTVRSRLQRRVVALLDSDERSESDDRLSTLLFVALTNYPYKRVLTALGNEYSAVLDQEQNSKHIRKLTGGDNPPLALTEEGGLAARHLLEMTAA